MAEICGFTWTWWDGEYDGECELPRGHGGPHYDGMSYCDDDYEPVDKHAAKAAYRAASEGAA